MTQFASVADLELFIDRKITAEEIERAELLLQLASSAIQEEAGQTIEFVEDDEVTIAATLAGTILLPEIPVVSIESVTYRDTELVVDTDYTLDARAGILTNVFGWWTAPTTVVYSHGFVVIPDAIRTVCLQATARAFTATNEDGDAQVGVGQGVLLIASERRTIGRYRP